MIKPKVEHLKTTKNYNEKESQISSILIYSGPRNEHNLLILSIKQNVVWLLIL